MRILFFIVAFTIAVSALVASHVYLYRRLFRDTARDNRWRTFGRRLLVILGIGCLMGIPIARYLNVPGGTYIGRVWYLWGALAAFCLVILLIGDAVRWAASKWTRQPELDVERREFFARGLAGAATVTAASMGGSGVALALSDPNLESVDVPIETLPLALDGFKIVQLSDTHFGPTLREEFADHLVERVNQLSPDLVALTGDLIDGSVEDLGSIVKRLTQIKSRHGLFFVTGNHEYYSGAKQWVDALSSWGVRVLRNEWVTIEHEGAALDLVGVDDWRASRFLPDHGYDFAAANAGRDLKRTSVLLSHQPKAIHDASKGEIDLVLSGHTHGGQIWPGKYFVKLIQPYVSGLHKHSERTWIYVHSGTGYWGPPVRVGVPSEIALLRLKKAASRS
ncbi:MAG: metallophosphoesterase [Myxococcota bacterium]|nr:metallophosphoesterase [Myxococcota bacterium]